MKRKKQELESFPRSSKRCREIIGDKGFAGVIKGLNKERLVLFEGLIEV